jgi:hypothetical protein
MSESTKKFDLIDILKAGMSEEGKIFVKPEFGEILLEELEKYYAILSYIDDLSEARINLTEFRAAVNEVLGKQIKEEIAEDVAI